MRIRISMGGSGVVPFNYNHYLAGVLYSAFREADLKDEKSLEKRTGG